MADEIDDLRRRATGGDRDAQYKLYQMLKYGQTKAEAEQWRDRAAAAGQPDALYAKANEIPHDSPQRVQAIPTFQNLAHAGHPESMWELGLAYLNGYGVPVDLKESRRWLEETAKTGDAQRQSDFASLLRSRRGEATRFPEDLPAALHWYTQAANQGQRFAMVELGEMYLIGQGVPQDRERAQALFIEAAAKSRGFGDASEFMALRNLGFAEKDALEFAELTKKLDSTERAALLRKALSGAVNAKSGNQKAAKGGGCALLFVIGGAAAAADAIWQFMA